MDNYYNSVYYTEVLLQKMRICGTTSKCLKITKKGGIIFRRNKHVQVWQSNKEVSLISSIHSIEMEERSNVDRIRREKIMKPKAFIDYNKYMKGVD